MPKEKLIKEKVIAEVAVVFCLRADEVLLAMKPPNTGKIGAGKWNGYGGVRRKSETIKRAALRELKEESNLKGRRTRLEKVAMAIGHMRKRDGTQFTTTLHVFFLHQWKGRPRTSKEMTMPTWFRRDKLPLKKMMPADADWLPRVLKGERLYVETWYGPGQETLERKTKIRKAKAGELL